METSGILLVKNLIMKIFLHNNFSRNIDGVFADLSGIVSTEKRNDGTYMHVDKLNIILDVQKPKLSVAKIFNNNRILSKLTIVLFKSEFQ